ncbi:MAG: TraR/DksA family transcriptional regulator [Bacteroidia bacterium]|nr:TraR/DksA family transcriptional regulator [Bacteroidia bacterium]
MVRSGHGGFRNFKGSTVIENMANYSAEEIAHLKKAIDKKLARLREDVVELREQCKPISPDNAIGRISRMDAINNRSVNEATLRQSENQLKLLEKAITEIDSKDFGLCRKCERVIPYGRLVAMPESDMCIACASK